MDYTDVIFGDEAKEALRKGAEIVYKAVSVTLGAGGRNCSRQIFGSPKITNDGVSIARAIHLKDPFMRQGADLLKQAAEQTNTEAGDGTTTSIILAYRLFEEGLKEIQGGRNPMEVRDEIEKYSVIIQDALKDSAKKVSTLEELQNVATISVENPENGRIVAEAVDKAGDNGMVFVEEDAGQKIIMETSDGYRFDRGLMSPYLVTNVNKLTCEFAEETKVLVTDKKFSIHQDILPLITDMANKGFKRLIIISDDFESDAMAFIVKNRMENRFHAALVKKPMSREALSDIAVFCGATLVSAEKGVTIPKIEHLGSVQKFVSSQMETTLIGGAGDIKDTVESLQGQIESAEDYDKEALKKRLSALLGKTIILKIGSPTEAETKYLKDKFDDAVNATRAAKEEGIVEGGGMALFNLLTMPVPQYMGRVLMSCTQQVAFNAGYDGLYPFNAKTRLHVHNLFEEGIIDPVKVTRTAVKNAFSLAGILLTTETVIAVDETPNKKDN